MEVVSQFSVLYVCMHASARDAENPPVRKQDWAEHEVEGEEDPHLTRVETQTPGVKCSVPHNIQCVRGGELICMGGGGGQWVDAQEG